MSGGSFDYLCYRIDECSGKMHDIELDDMMHDLSDVLHDLEWLTDGDISEDQYRETVRRFKDKWFKASKKARYERLKSYVDERMESVKTELYKMIEEA